MINRANWEYRHHALSSLIRLAAYATKYFIGMEKSIWDVNTHVRLDYSLSVRESTIRRIPTKIS